jgi:hypothetical protein
MILTPELQSKIHIWRQKAIDGSLSLEEMREAIIVLRSGRVSASVASDKSRAKKAVKVVQSADDLLKELGEL